MKRLIIIVMSVFIMSCKDNDTENNKYSSINNEEFSLNEIKNIDGVFLVISTSCSSCYAFFEYANKLNEKGNKGIKYTALLIDPLNSFQEYKKGVMYKTFGFLNNNWTVISSKELPTLINKNYTLEKHGTPFIFFKKGNEIIDLNRINSEKELIEKIEKFNQ